MRNRQVDYAQMKKKQAYEIIKRTADIIAGAAGCALLVPVIPVVKAVYSAGGDHASVIYRQERVGLNGKPFELYKIRTMQPGAEDMLDSVLENEDSRREWDTKRKIENDPRVTGPGRFLRKSSIDELPQFFNILKGDMSLIGPRPLVKGELEHYGGTELYNSIKPGLTGWWACNGRQSSNHKKRLELEYYYINNRSVLLDLKCLIKTVAVVISGKGAL